MKSTCQLLSLLVFLSHPLIGSAEETNSLPSAIRKYVTKEDSTAQMPSYKSASVDLNNDHINDAIVLLTGNEWCGSGGCTLVIFHGTKDGFHLLSTSTITNEPIKVANTRSNDWLDIFVLSGGSGRRLLRFNGSKYPLNPSMQPKVSQANWSEAVTVISATCPVNKLTTTLYVVSISTPCGGDDRAADDISYTGVNRNNSKTIDLKGRNLVRYCPGDEEKEVCDQLGYEFKNGDTLYIVKYDGTLQVTKGTKVLFEEHGTWSR